MTGVWVVVLLDEVVLSLLAFGVEVGSVLEVVEGTVDSAVEEGSAEVVGSVAEEGAVEVEEVVVVVGSAVVLGSVEVSLEVVEVDEVVDVVSGTEEEDEVVSLVISDTMLERPALWAATAVNSRAWMKNERLERRMVGITNVSTEYRVTKEFDPKSRTE